MTWVHDQIFAAGGDHIPNTWGSFADQTGISVVIHLSGGKPANFNGPSPTGFLWLDIDEETNAPVEARLLAGRFLLECVEADQQVLIHSSQGRHRTRWVYVAFRLTSGARLRPTLRKAGEAPWMSPYTTDLDAWEAFEQALRVPTDLAG